MRIEFDPVKNDANVRRRGLSFERAAELDFEGATYLVDERHAYGEVRHIAMAYLKGRLHHLCFVEIEDGIRVISFRKANAQEAKRYGKQKILD